MKTSKADEMLVCAKNALETKKALEMGANVDAKIFGTVALIVAPTAEQTKLLIEAGANVNARGVNNCTALMEARTVEQTKLLLAAGADIHAIDRFGDTALVYAWIAEQAKILIEAGVDTKDLHRNMRIIGKEREEIEKFAKEKEIQALIAKNKERLKNIPKTGEKSGVVIADRIASKQISGEEKRTITPEVGKELRQEIVKELSDRKNQRK